VPSGFLAHPALACRRASLAHHIGVPGKFKKDFVSFVSVGDGSVNHAHYLAAVNFSEYAAHRGYKVCAVHADKVLARGAGQ
jgi:hypothetical protein